MINRVKLAAAAMTLAACFAAGANAQTSTALTAPSPWTSADGGLHFTIPTGWARNEIPKAKADEVVLAVSKGDAAPGSPVLYCKLTIKLLGVAESGLTQAAMNARLQGGAKNITLDEKRVTTTGGITIIDGFLSMTPRILMEMKTLYVRGGKLYDVNVECLRTPKPVLTMDDLKTARVLFDTISVTP